VVLALVALVGVQVRLLDHWWLSGYLRRLFGSSFCWYRAIRLSRMVAISFSLTCATIA